MSTLSPGTTLPFDDDHFHEECAVFGVWGTDGAAGLTALGLHALQHRGQEACGIVAFDSGHFNVHRALGLVGDVFGKGVADESGSNPISRLTGRAAIGHTRYATSGRTMIRNIQPLWTDLDESGGFALAHNGNLTNARQLKKELRAEGRRFQSTTDTEVILDLVARSNERQLVKRLVSAMKRIVGAYSLVALSKKKLIAARDPAGVRPLVLGRLDEAWVVSSETCGLDIIGADYVRDVKPGEMIVIDETGMESHFPLAEEAPHFCIFEYVYFARPDSKVNGKDVYSIRRNIGRELAREEVVAADMVVPVPDSGTPSALGYAEVLDIPFELAITRNHYVGRSFIEPDQRHRDLAVLRKLNANRGLLRGKRVVLVDDSIVRGTTSKRIVEMVRDAGASEVHLRIASPPTISPCFYGVDTPSKSELIYNQFESLDQVRNAIKVDSLAYLSIDGLYRAVGESRRSLEAGYCDACFSGDYAIPLLDENDKGVEADQGSLFHEGQR